MVVSKGNARAFYTFLSCFSYKPSLIIICNVAFDFLQEYLKGIGGETDEINYYQFCVLLDAGTGGNPSRVSSYLS